MSVPERSLRSDEILWRPSTPDSIEADLASLWRDAGKSGPISRALMSNLVVVSRCRSFPAMDDVARRHPARMILLGYTAGAEQHDAPESAEVGLLTIGEATSRYGVELIAVHTACADESIHSIVRACTLGDVPTTVWWTGDLSDPVPPTALTTTGRQLVYDSRLWHDVKAGVDSAIDVLGRAKAPDLADLNWRKLAAVRSALVHVLRVEQSRDLKAPNVHVTHRPGEAAAGWLIAGWLSAGIKGRFPSDLVRVQEADLGDEIVSVRITENGWSASASMNPDEVKVTSEGRPPFVVPVAQETEADAVAAELRSLGHHVGLQDALRILAARPAA